MTDTNNQSISAANPLAQINTMIAKVDDVVSSVVADIIRKNNEVKAGPVSTLVAIATTLNAEVDIRDPDSITSSTLVEVFPRPVSKPEDEAGTNGPHEFFEAPKPDKTGTLKMRKCNFWTEAWADTAEGKAQQFKLDQLSHFEKGGDPTKAEKLYQDMPAEKRLNLKEKLGRDKTTGRSMLRKGFQVFYALYDLADYSDRVRLEFDVDIEDPDQLSGCQYPFNLIDAKRIRNYRPMTVADVAKLDVPMALADAGTEGSLYDALCKQLTRGAGTTAGEKANFDDIDAALKTVRQWNNYLDIGTEDGKEHYKLFKNLMAKKGADALILEIGSFVSNVKALWNPVLEVRYQRMMDKQMESRALDEVKPDEAKADAA